MCLSLPGRITWIDEASGLRTGRVDFDGAAREVRLVCVPEAGVGDFVVVHLGFAVSVVDAAQARRTLAVDRALRDRLGPGPRRTPAAGGDGFGR